MTETPTPTEGYKPTVTETRRRWAMRQAADLIRARSIMTAGELDVDAAVTLADWLLETEADTAARHADDAARVEAINAAYLAAQAPPVPAASAVDYVLGADPDEVHVPERGAYLGGSQSPHARTVATVRMSDWGHAVRELGQYRHSNLAAEALATDLLVSLGIRVEAQA